MERSTMKISWIGFLGFLGFIALGCGPGSDEGPGGEGNDGTGGGTGNTDSNCPTGGPTAALDVVVQDPNGTGVIDATVKVCAQSGTTDISGLCRLEGVPVGSMTVSVSPNKYLAAKQQILNIQTGQSNKLTLKLDPKDFKLLQADAAIVEQYLNSNKDWTANQYSFSTVSKPTKGLLLSAVYSLNKATQKGGPTQNIAPTGFPSALPPAAGSPIEFKIPQKPDSTSVLTCPNQNAAGLDVTSMSDAIPVTITQAERDAALHWRPMSDMMLAEADSNATLKTDLTKLACVGLTISKQTWGFTLTPANQESGMDDPQSIQEVYLHNNEIWVKVVFEKWVNVGTGIKDDDGDGRPELFAKVPSSNFSTAVYGLLSNYATKTYDPFTLGSYFENHLSEALYSARARLEKYLGEPFDLSGFGTFQYPFAVVYFAKAKTYHVIFVKP